MGLHDAARALGVDPFEVVRLLGVARVAPDQFRFTSDQVDKLRQVGGIEAWWTQSAGVADDNAHRGRLRSALQMMLDKQLIGDKATRLDNVWRGLGAADAAVLRDAVACLVKDGILIAGMSPRGRQLAIHPKAPDEVRRIAAGTSEPASIAALWKR